MTTNTNAAELGDDVKKSGGWLIAIGIAVVILGLLALGAPLITGIAVATLVGVYILVAGVFQVVYAFKSGSIGSSVLLVLIGLISIIGGLFVLVRPMAGLLTLTLLLAIYFFVDGLVEIVHAFRMKPLAGWGSMLFSGIVAVICGILIWRQWPLSGVWAVGLLAGIKILFSGWSMIAFGGAARALTKTA